jgi:hypothetical protein
MTGSLATRLLPSLLAALALAVCPVSALAGETETTATTGAPAPSTTTATPPTGPSPSPPNTPTVTGETTSTAPASAPTSAAPATPQVQAQAPQATSGPAPKHTKAHHTPNGNGNGNGNGTGGGTSSAPTNNPKTPNNAHAPSPSSLTPPPPSALGSSLTGGVPDFFIANFPMPPFLLPIYQAAGHAYGIPWEVLAGINEVETDYGRDLSISSAGAEGWMQFLPSTWAQYGVDANGDGYADPYNPADAIFAAARYLRAAGGDRNIRAAIFSYNHSQSYVASVLLRAQLLHGTPPQLLSAVADLAEARFPVHAPSHFSDGFPAMPGHPGRTLAATAIYSTPGAPVIAVQDGVITAIGHSAALGRYVSLRDAYGDTYTYGDLGSVATLYPVLTSPHVPARALGASLASRRGGTLPPASAGVQPHSPISTGAVSSGLAMGAAATLETTRAPAVPTPLLSSRTHPAHISLGARRVFRSGHEIVHLRSLQVGSQVIAGTVIGHLGTAVVEEATTTASAATPDPAVASVSAGTGSASASSDAPPVAPTTAAGPQARMIFQIHPAGLGAPAIDPKPILDSWVQLQGSLIYRATGKHRFPAAPPAASSFSTASSSATTPAPGSAARLASVLTPTLTPNQWLQLMARLGSIPDPVVASGHSPAALPITKGNGNGNH